MENSKSESVADGKKSEIPTGIDGALPPKEKGLTKESIVYAIVENWGNAAFPMAKMEEMIQNYANQEIKRALEVFYESALRKPAESLLGWVKIENGMIPDLPDLSHELIHVQLSGGATARVSPGASPELLGALNKMAELAKAMPDSSPIKEKECEIPQMGYELSALSDIAAIEYGTLRDRLIEDQPYDSSDIVEAHEAGQMWMYHKMLEEITKTNTRYSDAVLDLAQMKKHNGICQALGKPVANR